jgi:hypothetical protein
VPADQPAKDTVNQRGEVAVAPLVIGEGCFSLGDGKLSMDRNKPVARDRDLERLVRLKVPVPLGFAPSPAMTISSFSARFSLTTSNIVR